MQAGDFAGKYAGQFAANTTDFMDRTLSVLGPYSVLGKALLRTIASTNNTACANVDWPASIATQSITQAVVSVGEGVE